MSKDSHLVYFIRQVGGVGPIKIGCSRHVASRLDVLSVWSPVPLEVLVAIPGGFVLERNIQRCFADLHSHKEWFHPGDRLLAAIEALKGGLPVSEAINLEDIRGDIVAGPSKNPEIEGRRSYVMRMTWAWKKHHRSQGSRAPDWATGPMHRWNNSRDVRRPTEEEFALLEKYLADPAAHAVFEVAA